MQIYAISKSGLCLKAASKWPYFQMYTSDLNLIFYFCGINIRSKLTLRVSTIKMTAAGFSDPWRISSDDQLLSCHISRSHSCFSFWVRKKGERCFSVTNFDRFIQNQSIVIRRCHILHSDLVFENDQLRDTK